MKDSRNGIAVVGAKEFTQIFAVCGFDVHEKFTDEIKQKYALIINTDCEQEIEKSDDPYPIILEVKWKA